MPIDSSDQEISTEEYDQNTLQISQLSLGDRGTTIAEYEQSSLQIPPKLVTDEGIASEECDEVALESVDDQVTSTEECSQDGSHLQQLFVNEDDVATEKCGQELNPSINGDDIPSDECAQYTVQKPLSSVNDEDDSTNEQGENTQLHSPGNDQDSFTEECNENTTMLLPNNDQDVTVDKDDQNTLQILQLPDEEQGSSVEERSRPTLQIPQLSVSDHDTEHNRTEDLELHTEEFNESTLQIPQVSINDHDCFTEERGQTKLHTPKPLVCDQNSPTEECNGNKTQIQQLSVNDQETSMEECDQNTLQVPQLSLNDFSLIFDDEESTDSRTILSSSDQSESSECISPRKKSRAKRTRSKSTSDLNDENCSRLRVYTPVHGQRLGSATSSSMLEKINSELMLLSINNESGSDSTSRSSTPSSDRFPKRKRKRRLRSLKASLFPNIPPTIHFATPSEKIVQLPTDLNCALQWKLSSITPYLVKEIVTRSGFTLTKDDHFWTSTWGRYITCQQFKLIKENQKVNHFPGSFNLGRKDKLWMNIHRMQSIHGEEKFGFMPETYILPQELKLLRATWVEEGARRRWIIKPPASSKGIGVSVVHRWCDIPKTEPAVAQKYISRPYLINDTKFDLRLYVLVTSFDPLRIYLFNDGLVRFASVKYTRDVKFLGEKYIHLTNYSINRNNASYTSNDDANVCQGHKWTLKSLWAYFRENGVDEKQLMSSLVDVVIKTIISCEDPVNKLVRVHARNRYNCYELFGFDIMLDSEMKPWLLEVNISPSLHSNSRLDSNVKSQLIKDMFNTVGFHIPEEVKLNSDTQLEVLRNAGINPQKVMCLNTYLYRLTVTPEERMKQLRFEMNGYNESILRDLSPSDVRQLVQSEDELARCGHFKRIFPSETSYVYLEYFERQKYYNLLLDAWERRYCRDRSEGIKVLRNLCEAGVHLQFDSSFVRPSKLKSLKTNIKTALSKVGSVNTLSSNNVYSNNNETSFHKGYFGNYRDRENGRMGTLPPLIQEKFNVASCTVSTNCSMI